MVTQRTADNRGIIDPFSVARTSEALVRPAMGAMGWLQLPSDIMSEAVSGPVRNILDAPNSFARLVDFLKASGAAPGAEYGVMPTPMHPDLATPDLSVRGTDEIKQREFQEQALSRLPPDASAREKINVSAQALRDYHDVKWYEEMGLGVIPELLVTPMVFPLATGGKVLSTAARAARPSLYRAARGAGASPGFAKFATKSVTSPFVGAGKAMEAPAWAVRKSDEAFIAGVKAPYRTVRGTYMAGPPDDLLRDPVEQAMRSFGRGIDPRVGRGMERGVQGMNIDPATGWARAPWKGQGLPTAAAPSPSQGLIPYEEQLTPIEVDEILGVRGETLYGAPKVGATSSMFPEGTANQYESAPWLAEGRFRNTANPWYADMGLEDLSTEDFNLLAELKQHASRTDVSTGTDAPDKIMEIISKLSPTTVPDPITGVMTVRGTSIFDIENAILAGRWESIEGIPISEVYLKEVLTPDGSMSIINNPVKRPLVEYLESIDSRAIDMADEFWQHLDFLGTAFANDVDKLFGGAGIGSERLGEWRTWFDNMVERRGYGPENISFRDFIYERHGTPSTQTAVSSIRTSGTPTANSLNLVRYERSYRQKTKFGEPDLSSPPVHMVVINGEERFITSLEFEGLGKSWFEYRGNITVDNIRTHSGVTRKKDMVAKLESEAAAIPVTSTVAPIEAAMPTLGPVVPEEAAMLGARPADALRDAAPDVTPAAAEEVVSEVADIPGRARQDIELEIENLETEIGSYDSTRAYDTEMADQFRDRKISPPKGMRWSQILTSDHPWFEFVRGKYFTDLDDNIYYELEAFRGRSKELGKKQLQEILDERAAYESVDESHALERMREVQEELQTRVRAEEGAVTPPVAQAAAVPKVTIDEPGVIDLRGLPSPDEGIDGIHKSVAGKLELNTFKNPMTDRNEYVFVNTDNDIVMKAEITRRGEDLIRLNAMESLIQGEGNASKWLDSLTSVADGLSMRIELTAQPFEPEIWTQGMLGKDDLIKFYERKGFEFTGDRGIRLPKKEAGVGQAGLPPAPAPPLVTPASAAGAPPPGGPPGGPTRTTFAEGPDGPSPEDASWFEAQRDKTDEQVATVFEQNNQQQNVAIDGEVEKMGMDPFIVSGEEKASQSAGGIFATLDKMGYLPAFLRDMGDFINPAQKMVREGMRKIWVATMVEADAKSWFQTAMPNRRQHVISRLASAFNDPNGTSGQAVLAGDKVTNANYIGGHSYEEYVYRNHNTGNIMDSQQRIELDNMVDERIAGTLKDIIENPQLYDLNQQQLNAIIALNNHHTWAFNRANSLGLDLKYWESNPNGAYIPTLTSRADTNTVFEEMAGDIQRVGRTSTYRRAHRTLRDRMASEYSQYMTDGSAVLDPELNVSTLIEHADNFKSDAVGGEAFSQTVGGRSKLGALRWLSRDEIDPKTGRVTRQGVADAKRLLANRKRLQGKIRLLKKEERAVKRRGDRYNSELREAVSIDTETMRARSILDDMLDTVGNPDNAISDDMGLLSDIEELSRLNEQARGARYEMSRLATNAERLEIQEIFKLKELEDTISQYKKYLDDFNDDGTSLLRSNGQKKVEEGLNRWFTRQEAGTIESIRRTELGRGSGKMDKIYNVMSLLNQTKLSGDFSPFFYQLPLATFFQPMRSANHLLRLLGLKGRRPGDKFLIQDFINAKKENWDNYVIGKEDMLQEFTQYTNIPIAGAAEKEFRAGLIPVVTAKMGRRPAAFGSKYEALNDFMYRMLTRVQIDSYFSQKQVLLRAGFDEEAAKVAAGQATQWIVPRLGGQARRLGLSGRRQSWERIPFTSISFVRMPLEFGREASTGLSKIFFHGASDKRWADPKNLMNPKSLDEATGEMVNLLTPSEYAASKMAINLAGSLGTVALLFGIQDGLTKDLSGGPLLQHALKRVNPLDPDFWTVWGGVRIGGPVRSLARQIIPQKMDIGGYKPFGEHEVPFGGLPRFFTGRTSPFMRFWQELVIKKDWRGNAIMVDNGLASQVNFGLWGVGAFTPISITELPTFLREEGARAIPSGMPGAGLLLDEQAEGDPQRYGKADWGGLGKSFLRELLGASVVETTARRDRDTGAIAWAQANNKKYKTDSEGRFSFWSLDESSRAQFMQENDEIGKDLRKETQQLADAGVGTYDKQLELYRIKDNFLMNLDIVDSHYQKGDFVSAYKMYKEFRDKFYDDRSNVFRQLELDPEEEPVDINSQEYAMWRYSQLFDEATLKEDPLTGKERDSSQWKFSPEKFGILLDDLRDEWRSSNAITENADGQVVPMWEYVKSQQRLIEMEYPESVQTMAKEVRAINDSGWWDILNPSTLRPLLVAYMGKYGRQFSEQVDVFLEASPEARVDLMRGNNRDKYNFINNTYNTLTRTSVANQTGGPIGMTKLNFIRQNPDIAQLLYKYDFAFPGKTLMDLNRSSQIITSSGLPSSLMEMAR